MICKYCGRILDAQSAVCSNCGARVADSKAYTPVEKPRDDWYSPSTPSEPEEPDFFPDEEEKPEKKNNSRLLPVVIFMAGLILALVLVVVIILLWKTPSSQPDEDTPKTPVSNINSDDDTSGLSNSNIYLDVYNAYGDYVLPDSNKAYKCYADIEALTEEELTIAEQEIYARHGKKFSDADLQAYFDARDWYTPGAASFTPNYHEQANLDLIRIYREKQDGSLYRSGNGYLNAFSQSTNYAIQSSSSRLLTSSDLYGLSEEQLCVARNEILARHGWIFEDANLREYFYSKEWYRPSIPGAQFDYSVLSSTEQSNISLIKVYEGISEGGTQWSASNPYKAVYYKYEYQNYIFSGSSSRYLQKSELYGMTEDELCIARNEIFARNGYTFKSTNLMEYFLHRSWYKPHTAPGDSDSIYFSTIENANINLLNEAEKAAANTSNKIYNGSSGVNLSSLDTTLGYTLNCDIISMKVPNYWKTYAKIEIGTGGVSFYEKSSKETHGGHLFTIAPITDYTDFPEYKVLGQVVSPEGNTFPLIAWYATDCQFEMDAYELYNKMWYEDSRIFQTISGINGWTFIPA